jgi:C4-dicarboxylate transporter DctM subunit
LFLGVPIAISLGLSSSLPSPSFPRLDVLGRPAAVHRLAELHAAGDPVLHPGLDLHVDRRRRQAHHPLRHRLRRPFRGGLAIASVFACMLFAALSGSSPATVVAIGTIAIAGMRQVGYTKEFAAGVIANAGTLGILIPPSIVMVVYAAAVDVSVGRMFLAGVIPGIVAGLMLMIAIYVNARIKRPAGRGMEGWGELMNGGKEAGWGLFLIVIILGGIYGGVFTPTEAAAVAAVYAFFIANFVYRDMGPTRSGAIRPPIR